MLKDYEKKRDFARTREPKPSSGPAEQDRLRFVVQKHAASRLHYDFRLELDGVLKSWAVPKGPSADPGEKRLAVLVEDHPLDYSTFEGVIAHGNYGAGQVIVWDAGIYSPDEDNRLSFDDRADAEQRMRRALEKGKLSITLRGRKLQGSWTLVRTSRSPKDWLLIKHKDQYAGPEVDVLDDERSVQSGLTISDLKGGRLPDPVTSQAPMAEAETEGIRAMGKAEAFPSRLLAQGVQVSMDGRGRCMDNVFVERLWRSIKYEEMYLKAYQNGTEARKGIGAYLAFYNQERPHQALGYRSPGQVFQAVSPQRCLLEHPRALQSDEGLRDTPAVDSLILASLLS